LNQLARYRWQVGHHAAFLTWRLLAVQLEALAAHPAPGEQAAAGAAGLYDLYSMLFLYTAGVSPERYAATLRADLLACHPAFSGEWAPDYIPIPPLVRRVRLAHGKGRVGALAEAVRLNQRVHFAVAKKLVPQGTSLLQDAGHSPGTAAGEDEQRLYDAFFGVRRHPVCGRALLAQGARRAAQIMTDIAIHGLHGPEAGPPPFDDRDVSGFERLESQAGTLLLALAKPSLTSDTRGVTR
jgi:hypothetical protein